MNKYEKFLKDSEQPDIHTVRLPSEKEWKKLINKMSKQLHGYSDIFLNKDENDGYFVFVRYITDKVTNEVIDRIETLNGIAAAVKIKDGIDVLIDFCPLCDNEFQDTGIKSLNLIPVLLMCNKSIVQFQRYCGS